MTTTNERISDDAVRHSMDLVRYSGGVVRRLIALLNRVDSDLFSQLVASLERLPAESFTVERLDALLQSARELNARAYESLRSGLAVEMRDLAGYEAGHQAQLFAATMPAEVSFARVNVEQAYSAALARPMQGRLLREWAASIEADKMTRIRDALRIGYVEGQTVGQMVRRIRGTRAMGYKDGIIEIDRRNAEAVVRTATQHVASVTRDNFFAANADLIKGERYTATIDGRTTLRCASLDGQVFPVGKGPKPPLHWNCRSTRIPLLKSWRELGIDADELSPSTRASMDGQIPEDRTFGQWLKGKPAAFQDDYLGPTRGKLFRDGKLPIDRFVSRNGDTLTLDQLRERDAKAFNRAGL
jgi:SPP1 gp7 family putative phage head morphogenesis protein